MDDALSGLNEAWYQTNQRISDGDNTGLVVIKDKDRIRWTLLYDASEKLDDSFFKNLPKVEIADVMMFVGDMVAIWDGFSHIKGRYIKRTKPVTLAVNACLLSEAFGFGQIKMADMCDLSFNSLHSTREDFIRIDTLCAVNDILSNFICTLPVFERWNLLEDKLLADADGQKFATTNSTILNQIYDQMLKANTPKEVLDKFARISPIAWTHILFEGRYSFKKSKVNIYIAAMAYELEHYINEHLQTA